MITSIQIKPVRPQFHQAVAELMAYGFGHKFQKITSLSMYELAYVFEQMLNHPPMQQNTLRVIARQNEDIVGTMSLKWMEKSNRVAVKTVHANSHWWSKCNRISNGKRLLFITGLHLLKHTPKLNECYVEDLVVHPQHQGKGIGTQLLQWAQKYMLESQLFSFLSLHVASQNSQAIQLYERYQFRKQFNTNSFLTGLLLGEEQWHYMIYKGDSCV
ncbi:GNAT family N-acetyltransferase [Paenibacillus sp. SAF-068]|uniref:GNAT family N-acetyltransferase n=1 Tax=Paenibacillus sp. SAF-068 TaxID=3436864 RepID=UPI003F80DAFF